MLTMVQRNIASSFRKKVVSTQDKVEKVKSTTNSVSHLERRSLNFMITWENLTLLPFAPLHDISNYIKNMYQELPFHVDKTGKSLVSNKSYWKTI